MERLLGAASSKIERTGGGLRAICHGRRAAVRHLYRPRALTHAAHVVIRAVWDGKWLADPARFKHVRAVVAPTWSEFKQDRRPNLVWHSVQTKLLVVETCKVSSKDLVWDTLWRAWYESVNAHHQRHMAERRQPSNALPIHLRYTVYSRAHGT